MSQIPIIGEAKTDDKRVLRLDIYVLQGGPSVDFYWNETWAATVNPAWPQQVFLAALQALSIASKTAVKPCVSMKPRAEMLSAMEELSRGLLTGS